MQNIENKNLTEDISPEQIFQTGFGFAPARILTSGIDLEIFTHIANGKHTVGEIAEYIPADRRGIEILLNALVGLNFLLKTGNSYDLAPVSRKFLVKYKPTYLGEYPQIMDLTWDAWSNLTRIIKTGKPFDLEKGEEDFFQKLAPKLFSLSYSSAKVAVGILDVGKVWKNLNILDIAAGAGPWGIAFAEADEGSRVTAQDLPSIINLTKQFVNKYGLTNRYDYISGDLKDVDFVYRLI